MKIVEGKNLSDAWNHAVQEFSNMPASMAGPCVVTFPVMENFENIGCFEVRNKLDEALKQEGRSSVRTVANTIFPQSLWQHHRHDRHDFFLAAEKIWPRVKMSNPHGTYFYRMIRFENGGESVNQLEHIITTWRRKNYRRSALHAGIFDPREDHTHQSIKQFPCLQQVAFHPSGSKGVDGLSVVAFYANQILFEKAFGNYLGLMRLGQFMAREMGLKLKKVTCVASYLKLSSGKLRPSAKALADDLRKYTAA